MNATTTTTTNGTTKTTKTRGFEVRCPHCGAIETPDTPGPVLDLHTLDLICRDCDEPITKKDLERTRDEIIRLLKWLDFAETV